MLQKFLKIVKEVCDEEDLKLTNVEGDEEVFEIIELVSLDEVGLQ